MIKWYTFPWQRNVNITSLLWFWLKKRLGFCYWKSKCCRPALRVKGIALFYVHNLNRNVLNYNYIMEKAVMSQQKNAIVGFWKLEFQMKMIQSQSIPVCRGTYSIVQYWFCRLERWDSTSVDINNLFDCLNLLLYFNLLF